MIYSINAKTNQFVLLAQKPFAWSVLVPKSVGLDRGDIIKYIEVDSLNVPTGAELTGVIKYVAVGDVYVNNGSSIYVFCSNVSEGIGTAAVGFSLIVN